MKEVKKVEIDGKIFQLHPMKALKALKLDKEIMTLLIPVLSGIKGLDLSSLDNKIDLDLKTMTSGFVEQLSKLPTAQYEALVLDLLKEVMVCIPGVSDKFIENGNVLNDICGDGFTPMSIYKLIFEVMKYNSFTPFELLGNGLGIGIMSTSQPPTKKVKPNGNLSEKSESLLGS